MGSERPKQYLPLLGYPMIWHPLNTLVSVPEIERVFVVIAQDDDAWDAYDWSPLGPKLQVLRCGGATRAASVTQGLRAMRETVQPDDRILVHDAARACITCQQVRTLIAEVGSDPAGGLLAIPVADTLKRCPSGNEVAETVPREGLWQAQTPQMFPYGLLLEALERVPAVTDESSAVEAMGATPRLVAADVTNLKITYPQDLLLAVWILSNRKA